MLERAASGEKVTAKEIERLKTEFEKTKAKLEDTSGRLTVAEGRTVSLTKQRDEAQAELIYARADKDRLAAEVEAAQEEIERLKEDGVIHILPSAPHPAPDTVAAALAGAEVQFRADVDAALMNLRRVWQSADKDWQDGHDKAAEIRSVLR